MKYVFYTVLCLLLKLTDSQLYERKLEKRNVITYRDSSKNYSSTEKNSDEGNSTSKEITTSIAPETRRDNEDKSNKTTEEPNNNDEESKIIEIKINVPIENPGDDQSNDNGANLRSASEEPSQSENSHDTTEKSAEVFTISVIAPVSDLQTSTALSPESERSAESDKDGLLRTGANEQSSSVSEEEDEEESVESNSASSEATTKASTENSADSKPSLILKNTRRMLSSEPESGEMETRTAHNIPIQPIVFRQPVAPVMPNVIQPHPVTTPAPYRNVLQRYPGHHTPRPYQNYPGYNTPKPYSQNYPHGLYDQYDFSPKGNYNNFGARPNSNSYPFVSQNAPNYTVAKPEIPNEYQEAFAKFLRAYDQFVKHDHIPSDYRYIHPQNQHYFSGQKEFNPYNYHPYKLMRSRRNVFY